MSVSFDRQVTSRVPLLLLRLKYQPILGLSGPSEIYLDNVTQNQQPQHSYLLSHLFSVSLNSSLAEGSWNWAISEMADQPKGGEKVSGRGTQQARRPIGGNNGTAIHGRGRPVVSKTTTLTKMTAGAPAIARSRSAVAPTTCGSSLVCRNKKGPPLLSTGTKEGGSGEQGARSLKNCPSGRRDGGCDTFPKEVLADSHCGVVHRARSSSTATMVRRKKDEKHVEHLPATTAAVVPVRPAPYNNRHVVVPYPTRHTSACSAVCAFFCKVVSVNVLNLPLGFVTGLAFHLFFLENNLGHYVGELATAIKNGDPAAPIFRDPEPNAPESHFVRSLRVCRQLQRSEKEDLLLLKEEVTFLLAKLGEMQKVVSARFPEVVSNDETTYQSFIELQNKFDADARLSGVSKLGRHDERDPIDVDQVLELGSQEQEKRQARSRRFFLEHQSPIRGPSQDHDRVENVHYHDISIATSTTSAYSSRSFSRETSVSESVAPLVRVDPVPGTTSPSGQHDGEEEEEAATSAHNSSTVQHPVDDRPLSPGGFPGFNNRRGEQGILNAETAGALLL
ncbi:unnamed protein product [Amoebophrya sp. A120]|nr:unnamed protein product [Amoebophrya sp. A120]|eukprot:GSA120T00019487001.1